MDYRTIDMSNYPRASHFDYFKGMYNPYVGVTVQADITAFYDAVKSHGLPFFLPFLYNVSVAMNSIAEFRQRIMGDGIVEYSYCRTSHTVALDDGTYCYCALNSNMDFDKFLPQAICIQTKAKQSPSIDDGDDGLDLIYVSCIKSMVYTSLVQPTPYPADSNPRVTWGAFYRQGDKVMMPVTLLANHALVDGRHISEFYEMLFARLNSFKTALCK